MALQGSSIAPDIGGEIAGSCRGQHERLLVERGEDEALRDAGGVDCLVVER